MHKNSIKEAGPIVERAMKRLLATVSARGRAGSDVRTAIGDLLAHLDTLLQANAIGEPLNECFDLARKAGTTLAQIEDIRRSILPEITLTSGAALIKNTLLNFCFAYAGRIIADMTFVSREDVDLVKLRANTAFADAEEITADAMDTATYTVLVKLHAAISYRLIETARPLPRMLAYRFAAPLSTLIGAYRLYTDAARADELRAENKVVHPAFMAAEGRAMSA